MYCCGYQSANSNSTRCANGDAPFVLEDGAMIFGRAALSNASTGSTTETTNTTCASDGNAESSSSHSSGNNNSTAIGVGVGVPLGILALCAVAWALVERRRGKQRQSIMSGGAQMTAPGFMSQRRQKGPTELYSPKHTSSDSATHEPAVAEMMGPEARH
ncbi:hypothetical protein N7462_004308 [Penicillium macrosclerotiorum]|uniref:uncharacterized protein n=1 Tax=Penicillium macrosclerotiorum TaxID=303699 RepID=UPI002548C213|nr:uncharacterized protein N7462_004308 [Penicillium macrosclerotiorum]KAJ5689916.1 hypothetical protein N7462_004308 [Penicillium macrosclerotiorum]